MRMEAEKNMDIVIGKDITKDKSLKEIFEEKPISATRGVDREYNAHKVKGGKMLKVLKLKLTIDGNQILKGLNFSADKGQLVYILGKNGSGKSTFFRALVDECSRESGQIVSEGPIAYQQQTPILLKNMTVKENYESFKILFNNDGDENYDKGIFEMLKLDKIKNTVVEKISGGEKQRLFLAITLLRNKDIYLIDEADAALDPEGRAIFQRVIKYLKEISKTVVWISHHIKESFELADKCYLFEGGEAFEVDKSKVNQEVFNYNEERILNYLSEEGVRNESLN